MQLRDYIGILRRNWILVLGTTLVGLLVGGTISAMTKPTYSAETQLFVAIQSSGSVQELQQGNTFSQARVQSYVQTVTSPAVLQPAIDTLGLNESAEELSQRVTASSQLDTVLINISVNDESPVQAAAVARGVADSFVRVIDELEKPRTGGPSPVNMSVTKPATAPTVPSSPNTKINLALGLILGLGLGVTASVFRSTLDTRIRGELDLREVTDAPLLGGISFDQDATKSPLLTQVLPHSPRAESFRQLRTNLKFANVSDKARTVLVTSSLPGEGKSTTAANLGIALAQTGQTVCLVDADLRRPMINEYLGLDRSAGLTTALIGVADVDDLLQSWGDDSLYVLTSGQIPPNPSELLGSEEMKLLLGRLEQAFDIVIVDAPPLLPVTDAAVLSQHVGGVVLVVGSQKLRQQDLQKSLSALEMVNANILGVVLNRLPSKGPDAYSYTYYGHNESGLAGKSRRKTTQRSAASVRNEREFDDFETTIYSDVSARAHTFPRDSQNPT
ncbi:chromosome partitioning protein [Arthrobacter sp. AFG7.2]|uniref:polysaccharide biosynthesis tyrosine autokinase n=1 Tax=Arthrobacter sp. AFG7.2 TaxID=1688693 RepID=UPI000C9E375B|nr:polysaccharide biosynthesis tyrosine autokinase [Arthrobacter sp. AFG7.2]PNI10548.1 chromosome partitioning protein [Arthrobacter sp. AFG7.2]